MEHTWHLLRHPHAHSGGSALDADYNQSYMGIRFFGQLHSVVLLRRSDLIPEANRVNITLRVLTSKGQGVTGEGDGSQSYSKLALHRFPSA